MGKYLHVAKTYKVVWGDEMHFNWAQDEFETLMAALDVYVMGDVYNNEFAIPKDEFKVAIENLRNFPNVDDGWCDVEVIKEILDKLGYTAKEMADTLERYLNEAEPNADYLHFTFY